MIDSHLLNIHNHMSKHGSFQVSIFKFMGNNQLENHYTIKNIWQYKEEFIVDTLISFLF